MSTIHELQLGPGAAGSPLTPDEFDTAKFERGWRYELIHGVLVVSPATSPQERDPNEELGYWLRSYRDHHVDGPVLDKTLPEHDIHIGDQRRRADRVIWAGLGRLPAIDETPTIAIEFVSEGKRNMARDYEEKRREYLACGIKEYWVINRFERTMRVYRLDGSSLSMRENDVYQTDLLPNFELNLSKLLATSDAWDANR